jgi:hypothetical protein
MNNQFMTNGGQYAPQIIGNTTKTNVRGPQSSSSGVIPCTYTKNSSVTSKMSGIERVGGSSSTGPTLKSGEKSQYGHGINIMKQNATCKSFEQKKPVSQQRNLGATSHNATM